jgi:hypothetical protein
MTDDQVIGLARVVATRKLLEDAVFAHDEAVQRARCAGVSLRLLADSGSRSIGTIARRTNPPRRESTDGS